MKHVLMGENRCAIRVSDVESPLTALNICGKALWIWCDSFNLLTIDPIQIKKLKDAGYKICYVSPELHGTIYEENIALLQKWMQSNAIYPDAICTKHPKKWQSIF